MELLVLVGLIFFAFAVGFIGAPLLRSEDDLEPLYRPRPGVRQLYGPTEDDTPETDYGPVLEDGRTRCQHCGTVADGDYQYCEECLEQLT